MFDFWGFLLQTLSVSGAAVLILALKALFKDKLPPKWQFAVWGVLGVIMLMPAGMGGRYTLFNWRFLTEAVKSAFGDYGFTRVFFPFPVLTSIPETAAEWIFAVYVLGVVIHLSVYAVSYIGLRRVLHAGNDVSEEKSAKIQAVADEKGIKLGKIVEISGLPSAFVCGVFRPVLALPAEKNTDEKIILHELYHLKNRDTLWSILICVLRSVHWCNPLIVYSAKRALNDMEARCDQYVLESIAGEERREYGKILLSMANDKFSGTPGSTSIGNGGKNIKSRIANIARFKKYPQNMKLVSVCVLILLVFPLTMGAQALSITEFENSVRLTLASARSIPCTTPAGAFDAYGKAILTGNGYYRAMCAPENMQGGILAELLEKSEIGADPTWYTGFDEYPKASNGYYIYNFQNTDNKAYEGILVVELSYPPDGKEAEPNKSYVAYQNLRVEKENGRWVAIPLENFKYAETLSRNLAWGCVGLAGITYAGETNDIRTEMTYQTIHMVESAVKNNNTLGFLGGSYYDTTPKPDAVFTYGAMAFYTKCTYLGDDVEKNTITHIGVSTAPVYTGEEEPMRLPGPSGDHEVVSSSDGRQWVSRKIYSGWRTVDMDGGGGSLDPTKDVHYPEYIIADLYLNSRKAARFNLTLQKGVAK